MTWRLTLGQQSMRKINLCLTMYCFSNKTEFHIPWRFWGVSVRVIINIRLNWRPWQSFYGFTIPYHTISKASSKSNTLLGKPEINRFGVLYTRYDWLHWWNEHVTTARISFLKVTGSNRQLQTTWWLKIAMHFNRSKSQGQVKRGGI